jgi:hypothetical protein
MASTPQVSRTSRYPAKIISVVMRQNRKTSAAAFPRGVQAVADNLARRSDRHRRHKQRLIDGDIFWAAWRRMLDFRDRLCGLSHWGIENGLHGNGMEHFGRVAIASRPTTAAENFVLLPKLALTLLRRHLAKALDGDFLYGGYPTAK